MKSVLTIKPTYSKPYNVHIGINILEKVINELESIAGSDRIVVCTQEVLKNHELVVKFLEDLKSSFKVEFIVLPNGEEVKNIDVVLNLVEKFYKLKIDKGTPIVAIGGGALGDAIGFLSSIYMRGLPLVLVPTTLLSMIDSAIGGKNAVNMYGIKNLIGTFYQPSIVIEELNFLKTLPEREYKSGIAEAIKYGLALDRELYRLISENYVKILNRDSKTLLELITRCVACKGKIVESDEREEKMIRQVLNLGHTIGHAVEAYFSGKYLHGEAVMIGLVMELEISEELGYTRRRLSSEVAELARKYNLPYRIEEDVDIDKICSKILHDKKHIGDEIILPIIEDIGVFRIVKIRIDEYLSKVRKIISLKFLK